MKKSVPQQPMDAFEALLGGVESRPTIPGTRPDLDADVLALSEHLAPVLGQLPEAEPPADLFAAIEAEIDGKADAPMHTLRAEEGTWEQRSEKVWKKVLAHDADTGRSMYLLRCLPGASIKPHVHERSEHLFILEGEFWIGDKLYSAGDAQVSLPHSEHGEITMPGGCLVLISA